ncbi:hypothetical protein E2C01_073678 [Portunus trituberculatus]|uniref:Uncharacterized protein n=1 Tax=Portunus trituberculatus TaxID=210409 RepID=A0A5B7IAC8_PORTR|nr:hypothetical protein [Portunus trituberculatus]
MTGASPSPTSPALARPSPAEGGSIEDGVWDSGSATSASARVGCASLSPKRFFVLGNTRASSDSLCPSCVSSVQVASAPSGKWRELLSVDSALYCSRLS